MTSAPGQWVAHQLDIIRQVNILVLCAIAPSIYSLPSTKTQLAGVITAAHRNLTNQLSTPDEPTHTNALRSTQQRNYKKKREKLANFLRGMSTSTSRLPISEAFSLG